MGVPLSASSACETGANLMGWHPQITPSQEHKSTSRLRYRCAQVKRGTPRHPKVLKLIQSLNLKGKDTAIVIGHLELLWHFTAEFAPQGDIGRYEDTQIEGALQWYGRRGRLIEALTTSGWVDLSREYRLIIHDWHDHADDIVRKKLTRAGLQFLTFREKVTGQRQKVSGTVAENFCLPLPLPRIRPL